MYVEIVKTIAEIAGGLVGFVGIVFILGRRSERKLTVYEKNGLFHLLIGSVGKNFVENIAFQPHSTGYSL